MTTTSNNSQDREKADILLCHGIGAHDEMHDHDKCHCIEKIAAALAEARDKGRLEELQKHPCCCEVEKECDCKTKGYAKAVEDAAKVAEEMRILFFTQSDIGNQELILLVRETQRTEIAKAIRGLKGTK